MSEIHAFEADLRTMIERRQMVAIVGSGVSIATNHQMPNWQALIASGIEHCRLMGASDPWCQLVRSQLEMSSESDMLLSAAESVHEKLRPTGEFARWLSEVFKEKQPEDRSVLESIAMLGIPILTTNYDDLISKVTGLKHVTWLDKRQVTKVVRGEDRRVLHLHGHWDEPDSVVLGIRSYEAVRNHEHIQTMMKSLATTYSLLLIGCGQQGLEDPNLGRFLNWLKEFEASSASEHRHYRLVSQAEVVPPQGRLYALVYGENYSDLPGFLSRLRPSSRSEANILKPAIDVLTALPPSINAYLNRLAEATASLTLLGMGRRSQVELPIDEAYVPLRTTLARSLEERGTERFKTGIAQYEEDVDLGDVFQRTAGLKQRGVVLLGEPGSGKTTGARQLAWRLASRQSLPIDLGLPAGITPIFLRFRNLSRAVIHQKTNGLREFLDAETQCAEAADGQQAPGTELWNREKPGLLWILDGLDEIIDPVARQTVAGWVRKALQNRPNDWFLVTCRFQGYFRPGVPLGPAFVEFHVRPLDTVQIERFIRDWFGAAHRKLQGASGKAESRAQADSQQLLDILELPVNQTGHIRELCTNPLLLTILCIVFNDERKLPTGRAELYARCVRVLLEHWRRELYDSGLGTGVTPYDADAAENVLARVAWWMHQEQDRTAAPLSDLAIEAEKGLAEVAASSGLGRDGHPFLDRMRQEAGILAMSGEGAGRCGFLHLSFQEYLAAKHAVSEGLAQDVAARAASSWWREVALLSLRWSRPYCEVFFHELLAAGLAENHPDLTERCLNEALFPAIGTFVAALENQQSKAPRVAAILRLLRDRPEPLPELNEICQRLSQSQDPETRGFATEILVRRRIRSAAAPGSHLWVDEGNGITFVAIPAGKIVMGSEHGDHDERPAHRIRIPKDFWIGKYPVTNAQYGRFLKAIGNSIDKPQYWDDRRFNQPEQPVVGVTWDDANAYCNWAGCRLPTEAEWEYACRAGTSTEFFFGNNRAKLEEYGWFSENSSGQTQPVGAKKPNPWGLHDMHGNVLEWCQDWFSKSYYKASPVLDPQGPQTGGYRVTRGGGWYFSSQYCRSAYRERFAPSSREYYLGFRVVRSFAGQDASPANNADCGVPTGSGDGTAWCGSQQGSGLTRKRK